MTITEKEIREDFARFIRHEAMRANCTQEEIQQIITGGNSFPIKVVSGKIIQNAILNNAKREFE